jgi:hypothetical protein
MTVSEQIKELQNRPIKKGQKLRLSTAGKRAFPKLADQEAEVIREPKPGANSVCVRWPGRISTPYYGKGWFLGYCLPEEE